jgi:hypothetical protein
MFKYTRNNRFGIGRTEAKTQLHFVTGNCGVLLRKEYKIYMKVAFTGNKGGHMEQRWQRTSRRIHVCSKEKGMRSMSELQILCT